MNYHIALIGAGQLGTRHLQGLSRMSASAKVYIVDPNEASLEQAQKGFAEMHSTAGVTATFHKSIAELPKELDLVIIATSSRPRAQITRELLATMAPRYILFEKFLFPEINDYKPINTLLQQRGIKAWVNCARRAQSIYKQLPSMLTSGSPVHFEVNGGNWGLGCNSIHFIDIFSCLVGETAVSIDLSKLDRQLYRSKRDGYIEFGGTLSGSTPNGHSITLTSDMMGNEPPVVRIRQTEQEFTLFESGKLMEHRKSGEPATQTPISFLFQSELTGITADLILQKGECDLTPFDASSKLHMQFLEPAIALYNDLSGEKGTFCPIT